MISKDFKEFIELLNSHSVKYLVVGGYALAFHGHPRYTKDIDIWIWVDHKNTDKLMSVLDEFGFSSLGLQQADFQQPGYVIQLGHQPNRIDILTSVTGLDFSDCYPLKEQLELEGLTINFLDKESLKKNKLAVGRFQDLADLENLEGES